MRPRVFFPIFKKKRARFTYIYYLFVFAPVLPVFSPAACLYILIFTHAGGGLLWPIPAAITADPKGRYIFRN